METTDRALKNYTPEEDARLMELYRKHFNIKGIATLMHRSVSSVAKRIERLRRAKSANVT